MDPFTMLVIMIGVQLLLRAFLPGPKPLETIQITSSAEGQPIPFIEGSMRVAGELVYASDVTGVQVKAKAGKLWHYFQTCAYQLSGNPIQNVVRIWADSDVIYDARPGMIPIIKYPDMGFTWYNGTEDQDPDIAIEAIEGVGNVEAFRGCSYMVLVDIPLHQFGFRLPNFTVELASGESILPATVQRFEDLTNPGTADVGPGTEYGVLTANDDARDLFYTVHKDLTNTNWVITKYNTRTGANILEVALPGYFASAVAFPSGYFLYTQDSCWQNMMAISGDGAIAWIMNCAGASGSQSYELWQISTSDFSVINTFPLTVGTTKQLADGCLITNSDGSIVAKIGGLEGAGYAGHTPPWAHILRDNGQYQRLQFTDHPDTQNIYGGVFDSNNYLHIVGRDSPVALETKYWIRKYQINTNATVTFQRQRILRSANLAIGTNDDGFPVIIDIGSVSLSTQVAYNPNTDTINLIVRHDSDGFPGCEALFIDPGAYGDKKSSVIMNITVDNLNGDRRYIGGWVTNDYLCAYAIDAVYTDNMLPANAQSDCFVVLNISTGKINIYDIGSLWYEFTNHLGDRAIYNPVDQSIMTISTSDTESDPALRTDQLLILSLPHSIDLQVVCEEACKQVGLTTDDFDFTDFAGVPVTGAICKDRQSLREFLSSLQPAYFFDVIESDWKLKGVLRANGVSALTIPEDDVVDTEDNSTHGFQFTDTNPLEVPPWIDITYMDKGKDYQAGTQTARLPQASYLSVNSGTTVALPSVMTGDEAATAGQRLLDAAWAERDSISFALSTKYLALEPTDVVDLDRGGELTTVKFSEGNISPSFIMDIVTQTSNIDVYSQTRKSSSTTWFIPQTVKQYSTPIFLPLDTALFRASDDSPGMYCQVAPINDTFPINSCEVFADAVDTGVGTSGSPTYGTLSAPPADPVASYLVMDRDTVITVNQICGAWASQPEDDVLADPSLNLILVGNELIQYVTAVQVDTKIWEISTLLRGRCGTETLIGTQFTDDNVVAIDKIVMSNISYDGSGINNLVEYTAVDEGHGLTSDGVFVTQVCRRLKCFAPFVPGTDSIVRDGSDNLTVTFQYRSRISTRFFWPAAVFGTEERVFECDVLNAPGGTVLRTITSTASGGGSVVDPTGLTVYYSSSDQVTDFGSAQSSISIVLYQLNSILGRGYPGEELV